MFTGHCHCVRESVHEERERFAERVNSAKKSTREMFRLATEQGAGPLPSAPSPRRTGREDGVGEVGHPGDKANVLLEQYCNQPDIDDAKKRQAHNENDRVLAAELTKGCPAAPPIHISMDHIDSASSGQRVQVASGPDGPGIRMAGAAPAHLPEKFHGAFLLDM